MPALVNFLARTVPKIRVEGIHLGCPDSDYVNNHPIVKLCVYQMLHLSGGDEALGYVKAYETCCERAGLPKEK